MEVWKDIVGFEGLYMVSNLGRVKSLSRIAFQTDRKRILKEKILQSRPNGNGYCHVELKKEGISKTIKVHRLVATAFLPNHENKRTVNHIDSNRSNNELNNLEWCTDTENVNHALIKGRLVAPRNYGEKNGQSKLTVEQVLEIRKSNDTLSILSSMFGVAISTISSIKNKRRWAHV
jgi:hypothetical protein